MSVWNRRVSALLLAAVLGIGCAPVAAENPVLIAAYQDSGPPVPYMALPPGFRPPDSGPADQTQDPKEIIRQRQNFTLLPLAAGTTPDLPETVVCITAVQGGTVECPVQWDTSRLDDGPMGRVPLPGQLTAPEGYHFAASGSNTVRPDFVEFPLFFYGEGTTPEPLCYIDIPFLRSAQFEEVYRLGVGNDPKTLPFWGIEAECTTQGLDSFFAPIRWDVSGLDVRRPGRYTLPGSVDLPPCFILPEGFNPLAIAVEVGDPRPVMLANPRREGGNVVCDLAAAIGDFEVIQMEYRHTETSWWSCAAFKGTDDKMHGTYMVYDGVSLTILTENLDTSRDYSFRMRYQGVYSNVLHVRVPEGGAPEFSLERETSASPPPEDPFEDPNSGDHGGGDRGGQTLPPLRQQAPDGDEHEAVLTDRGGVELADVQSPAASRPALIQEQSSETGVSLSGARLERLAQPQDTVLFEKRGVAAELPSEFLRSLNLADGSLLEVTVEPVGENGFRLEITADGKAVEELPPTLVRLPLAGIPDEGVPLACYDARGNYVCDALWDPALGVVAVEITRPGEYVVREKAQNPPEAIPAAARPAAQEPPAPQPADSTPARGRFPAVGLAALPAAGVGAWMLLRRRKGKGSHE